MNAIADRQPTFSCQSNLSISTDGCVDGLLWTLRQSFSTLMRVHCRPISEKCYFPKIKLHLFWLVLIIVLCEEANQNEQVFWVRKKWAIAVTSTCNDRNSESFSSTYPSHANWISLLANWYLNRCFLVAKKMKIQQLCCTINRDRESMKHFDSCSDILSNFKVRNSDINACDVQTKRC